MEPYDGVGDHGYTQYSLHRGLKWKQTNVWWPRGTVSFFRLFFRFFHLCTFSFVISTFFLRYFDFRINNVTFYIAFLAVSVFRFGARENAKKKARRRDWKERRRMYISVSVKKLSLSFTMLISFVFEKEMSQLYIKNIYIFKRRNISRPLVCRVRWYSASTPRYHSIWSTTGN